MVKTAFNIVPYMDKYFCFKFEVISMNFRGCYLKLKFCVIISLYHMHVFRVRLNRCNNINLKHLHFIKQKEINNTAMITGFLYCTIVKL